MKTEKIHRTKAILQISSALKRAGEQARKRAKAYGTEALIAPQPPRRAKSLAAP